MPLSSDFQIPNVFIDERPFSEQLIENIRRFGIEDPNKIALIDAHNPDNCITYRTLHAHIHSLAAFLRSRQFGLGDVAAIVTSNCWQFAVAFAATAVRGGALSGASFAFTPFEIERQIADCGASVVFCSFELLESVRKATARLSHVKTLVVIDNKDERPPLRDVGEFLFSEALECTPDFSSTPPIDSKKHLLLIPYSRHFTPGTSGTPKGVQITHYNMSSIVLMYNEYYAKRIWPRIDPHFDPSKERMLIKLPLYHLYGLFLLAQSLLNGSTVILMRKFEGELFCRTLEDHRIRMLFTVPPLFLAKDDVVSRFDLSRLKFVLCGAAPLGADLAAEVKRRLPSLEFVVQGYGMTETTVASHFPVILAADRPNLGNVGIVAPNMQQMIVNVETGKEQPIGEAGEIWVRGPNITTGYYRRPKATAEAITKDGWLRTGDIGYVDSDGLLYIVDRLKELIKVKGLQVAPAELEDLLLAHPLIADAAVIGVPDERNGEVPRAFIVPKTAGVTAKDVHKYINARVAAYKQLKGGVQFVLSIPKGPSGKILRRELRDRQAKL